MRPFHLWLIEVGPLAWVITSLWIKQLYFSWSLVNVWWAPEESIWWWIRTHPAVFSATLASLLLLFAWLPLLPRIGRFLILLTLNLILTSLVLADILHVRFFGDVSSVFSLSIVDMVGGVRTTLVEGLEPTDALLYVDIIVGVIMFLFYVRVCRRFPRLRRRYTIRLSAGLLVLGLLLSVPTVHLVRRDQNGLLAYTSLQREVCSVIGLLPYHLFDVIAHWNSRRSRVGEFEYQRVRHFLESKRQKVSFHSNMFGTARGSNVIVISAESPQAFPIGLEIDGQPITPRLSAFAKESLYFTNFHDQTHLGSTSDGEFTTMQSLHPLPAGVVSSHYFGNHYRGLPTILVENGYASLSACAAPGDFWNMYVMHPGLGFQRSFFEESYRVSERIGPWLTDREFFIQTIPILAAQTKPFMAFLLSASNHHPYKLPMKYRVLKLGTLEGTLTGNYLHSVRYFDQAFGELVDQLRENGLLDKTVLVLYGDHQGYLEGGTELDHLIGFPEKSEYHRLLVRKKVPLLIRLPHGERAQVMSNSGGHLDTAPTVLSLLGISDDNSVMMGNDLTRAENSLVVFRDGSFTDGTYYFVNRFGPSSNSSCYEIATGRKLGCQLLEERHRQARERLEVSDFILRGDLIPALSNNGKTPSPK